MPGRIDDEERTSIEKESSSQSPKERYEAAEKNLQTKEEILKTAQANLDANLKKQEEMQNNKTELARKSRTGELDDKSYRSAMERNDENEKRYIEDEKSLTKGRDDAARERDKAKEERDKAKKDYDKSKEQEAVKEHEKSRNQDKEHTR